MPTLTVKDVIQAELLKVCREVTNRLREKREKKFKKAKYTNKEIARMREVFSALGYASAHVSQFMEINSILMDAPELKESELPLEMFCVFVCEQNFNSHRYTTNVPYILTSVTDKRGLDLEGAVVTVFKQNDQPRYATEDEVAYCIRNLNEKQLRFIMVSDIFKPIVEAAMNRAVSVEETASIESNGNGEDHEIELADGRKITVSSE